MKRFTRSLLLSFCVFFAHISNADGFDLLTEDIVFDSANYETINLNEDQELIISLNQMFYSTAGDSLAFIISQITTNGIIRATLTNNATELTLNGLEDRFGQASLTIRATNTVTDYQMDQSITVIVNPIDDPPYLANEFEDLQTDQFTQDSTLVIDLVGRFEDPEGDDISITYTFTNHLSGTDNSFSVVDASSVTSDGSELNVSLLTSTKYALLFDIEAVSNDTLSTSTQFEIIIDNGPVQTNPLGALSEDFGSLVVPLSSIFTDDDSSSPTFALSFEDFVPENANIIVGDTNALVQVQFDVNSGNLTLNSQSDRFGSYTLPVSVSSGPRTVEDELIFVINNVDDKPVINNTIQDQLLPVGDDLDIDLNELYEDVDSDISLANITLSTDNGSSFQFRRIVQGGYEVIPGSSINLANEPVINILATGSIGDMGTFTFSYDISDVFPGDDPIEDVFTLEISRPIATFYVDPSGNDGNDGSVSLPYATIQHAINNALGKDTIILNPGTYNENIYINKPLNIRSSLYNHSRLPSADVRTTAIQGQFEGGSVVNIRETDGVKLMGITIHGDPADNTRSSSVRDWQWNDGSNSFSIDNLNWETNNRDHRNDLDNNTNYYAIIKMEGAGMIESRYEWDCHQFFFQVDDGVIGGFTGNSDLILEYGAIDIYRSHFCADYNGARDYLLGNVPTGKLLNIDSQGLYDALIAINSGEHNMIGLFNRETINNTGAGVFSQNGSYELINCIVENNKVSKSQWDNAAGILAYNARYVRVIESEILNNQVQNGDASGVGVFWSDEFTMVNSLVKGNVAIGNNNCVSGGLMIHSTTNIDIINSIIHDNQDNCNEVRIGSAESYSVQHCLIENGLTLDNMGNGVGVIQNSIFLGRTINNWGPTNPDDLTIQYNLINANTNLDFSLADYGSNNLQGSNPGFNDPANNDFTLTTESTLIGAGTESTVDNDYNGNERPSPGGTNPDIGPYESDIATPDLIFTPYTYFNEDSTATIPFRFETSNWNEVNALEVADFNGDGYSEIIFNENLNSYNVILVDRAGNRNVILEGWHEIYLIKALDLDQDGDLDLVVGSHSSFGYLMNEGSGNWSAVQEFNGGIPQQEAIDIEWGDVTQDGRIDGVVGQSDGVRIYEFSLDGPASSNLHLNNDDQNGWLGDFGQVFLMDINGDTQLDLVLERRWFNEEVKDLLVFVQAGSDFKYDETVSIIGTLPPPYQHDLNNDLFISGVDIDQNGKLDLFVSYNPMSNTQNGYLKRFELDTAGGVNVWNEYTVSVKIDENTSTDINELYNSFIDSRAIALSSSGFSDLLLYASNTVDPYNDQERYFSPVLLTYVDGSEFSLSRGYFSQESFRYNAHDIRTAPNTDFGKLDDNGSLDIVVAGLKENYRNNISAFANSFDIPTGIIVPVPSIISSVIRGSKVEIEFSLSTPYFNIEVCENGNCSSLYSTLNGQLLDFPILYEVDDQNKVFSYFLEEGDYMISIQGVDRYYNLSEQVSSDILSVTGLEFQAASEVFDDFFNDIHLIDIDDDPDPEMYGFKRRFWYYAGERPSTLKIFNLDNPESYNEFVLDNTGHTPVISDFDLNGQADIFVNEGSCNWPPKPFAYLSNIDASTSVPVFSESFTDLNITISNGACDGGITNKILAIDIDQDGADELITATAAQWDNRGISFFSIEPDDLERSIVLDPDGNDAFDWNGENFDGLGALFKSKMSNGDYGNFIGLVHSYFDPDNDGDTDHILGINMYYDNKPLTALYFLESLGAGRVRPHYMHHFLDKSIIEIEVVYDEQDETRILLSISDDTNYWLDAYGARFVKFLQLDVTNDEDLFESIFQRNESISQGQELTAVNFKNNDLTLVNYSELTLDGIAHANLFESADINNDGLTDIVVVGTSSEDTWNSSALLKIYLQNGNGEFDPYISQISKDVRQLSFISSLNLIDINSDGQFDVVVSGRTRWSDNGVTLSFINNTDPNPTPIQLSTPTSLSGQNNGYKVELTWDNTNSGKISYATQIGTELNSYDVSLGKLNQFGNPLFPDRFETFHPSQTLVFDAYDLADNYYFRVKAIDQYGNTSEFSPVRQVQLSQPFTLMDQTIPGVEEGSVAWGDYDRDGDLDLAIMGKENGFITAIYRNDGGIFVDSNQNLEKQSKGDLEWVDYNNDGYLDLIVVGLDARLEPSLNIYQNLQGSFRLQNQAQIAGLTDATIAFGDADADGDQDMAIAGIGENNGNIDYIFELYTNRYNEGFDGIFERSPNFQYEGFVNGDIVFADFDNDGDLDLVYSGTGRGDNAVGGLIVNSRIGLKVSDHYNWYNHEIALKDASLSVGDLDLDGDLDMIGTGTRLVNNKETTVFRFYYNEFTKIDSVRAYTNFRIEDNQDIIALSNGDADLADFDNDGDLDILISGADEQGNPRTALYAQRGSDFFLVNAGFTDVLQSSVKWADFDTDGDMDVYISGKTGTISQTQLYENNTGSLVNNAPSPPANLNIVDFGFGKIKLTWDRADDDYTPSTSLSYIVALGDDGTSSNLFTTESNLETGYRLSPKSSSQLQNFIYLELDPGNYNFSVQSVDANYSGSPFSSDVTFRVEYIWKELNLGGIINNTLPSGENASVKFADFDGDGDFDLGIFGKNETDQWRLGLLENKAGAFEKIYDFDQITKGDFDWADVNNDGTLDMFITGEDPWDETSVRASLWINRTPLKTRRDSTFDGNWRWADGRIFDEDIIRWQPQEPNDDHSYYAFGVLTGSNPPEIYDSQGDCCWNTIHVEVPADLSIESNGLWKWWDGSVFENNLPWQPGEPNSYWDDVAYGYLNGNGELIDVSPNEGWFAPSVIEVPAGTVFPSNLLSEVNLLGTFENHDYYQVFTNYNPQEAWDIIANIYPEGSELLSFETDEELEWYSQNIGVYDVWIGLFVDYPELDLDNYNWWYMGTYNNHHYFSFDAESPNQAISIINKSFPRGSHLFVPNDQAEMNFFFEKSPTHHGMIGVIRKGFPPSSGQVTAASFQNSNLYFEPLVKAKVKFTDIDNNGTPELIYAGSTSSTSVGRPALKIYKFRTDGFNISAFEVDLANELPNLTESSIEFGDIDNDRDIDIVLSGFDPLSGRRTIIFKNRGLNFEKKLVLEEDTRNNLVGVQNGTIDLIDFDNDGDLDLVISGDSQTGDILQIYLNDGGVFSSLATTGLDAMKNGRTSWGDFNGDGYADVLYSGEVVSKGNFTGLAVYNPITGDFDPDNFDLSEFENAAVAFGDYDDDNDLDMVLTGLNKNFLESDPGSAKYISKLFINVRNESGRLGSLVSTTSYPGQEMILAEEFNVNEPPSIPVLSGISLIEYDSINQETVVEFSWEPSFDALTPASGLTYALRVGTSSGANDVLDSQANEDGTRKVSGKGNVEHNTSWNIHLPVGTYHWSVQAIDPAYSASEFSEELIFNVSEGGLEINSAPTLDDTEFSIRDIVENGYMVGTLLGSDPNNDELIYEIIGGNDDQIFSIGESSGIIVVADNSLLDADLVATYILQVIVNDGAFADTASVSIEVLKNFAPEIGDFNFAIAADSENGSVVGTVLATDQNEDPITYQIAGGNIGSAFSIDSAGQIIVVDNSLLNEGEVYNLVIEATDGFEVTQSNVEITITEDEGRALGIGSAFNSLAIYPNPTNRNVTISRSGSSMLNVRIANISGKIIEEYTFSNKEFEIDLSNRRPGVYLMIVLDESTNLTKTFRLIKNN